MQKGQTQVLILAGIVLVLAVAGGIFYLGRVTAPKPQPQPQNVATPSPQPSPTPDETVYTEQSRSVYTESDRSANWKTYTNEKYGISFKYPPSLGQRAVFGTTWGQHEKLIDLTGVYESPEGPGDGLGVLVVPNNERRSFQDYINIEKQEMLSRKDCGGPGRREEKPIFVDNETGIVLIGYCREDHIYVQFPDNQKVLVIIKGEMSKGSFDKLFDQILSTFRFLD